MRRDGRRGLVVKAAQRIAVAVAAFRQLGRNGIKQRQLGDLRAQVLRRGGARMACASRFGEMRDHVGFGERANGLECDELRIAGPDTDANELARIAGAHSPALASALTAAAVMALPPMRPRTIKNGTPRELAASASLDSAAPTKPTGTPRIAAGLGAPASRSSSSRNKAVGALPMATTAPASRSRHKSSAAAERVVASLFARSGTRGSLRVQITSLRAGKRARVMPCATISASQKIGAPAASAERAAATRSGPNTMRCAASTAPQAWIIRTATSASSAEKTDRSASARMMANERS